MNKIHKFVLYKIHKFISQMLNLEFSKVIFFCTVLATQIVHVLQSYHFLC